MARQNCVECDMPFCDDCFLRLHEGSTGMAFHESRQIDYKAMDRGAWMCGNCEVQPAMKYCCDCEDAFCDSCTLEEHMSGSRISHSSFIRIKLKNDEFMREDFPDGMTYEMLVKRKHQR